MSETSEIVPHRITKPIQLLAAWLTGLSIINASFLTAARLIQTPQWLPTLLVIAAVVNVPVFIISLFLLQTRFRPEMQEDTYYAKYLERKSPERMVGQDPGDIEKRIDMLADRIISKVESPATDRRKEIVRVLKDSEVGRMADSTQDNRSLLELYLKPDRWPDFHERWREDPVYQEEISVLFDLGLIEIPDGVVRNAKLTRMGKAVAEYLQSKGLLGIPFYGRREPRKLRGFE